MSCHLVTKSCPALFWPHGLCPPGSSVHGMFQARILEWVVISSFKGSSWPRDLTCISFIGRRILYHWAVRNFNWAISNPKRWCCESAALNIQQMWKTQQWPQDWKRSVFIPIPNKGNAKEYSNYLTIALISHASKVMLKILQVRLQQYVNHEFPDVQAVFRKGRGTRDHIANIRWIIEKASEFQKNIYFCFIGYTKVFDCVDHNCEIFLKWWEYESTLLASWETCM